jgi:hypothetical protein
MTVKGLKIIKDRNRTNYIYKNNEFYKSKIYYYTSFGRFHSLDKVLEFIDKENK